MLSLEEAQSRAQDLVTAARRAGADAADAIYACNASTTVAVRLGALEDVERSEGEEIGLRLFVGQRSASIAASDMNPATLATLVDRCIAMAREAPEDPYAGLAPEDRLLRGSLPELDIADPSDPEPALLRARALEAEEAARGVSGVTNSEGGGASNGRSQVALATSHGFAGAYAGTSHSTWASVLAGTGADMQRDHASHSARYLDDLDDPMAIGQRAGERAVARLNPAKIESGVLPVLFDPRIGSGLLGHLIGGMVGAAIARRSSFLLDSLGETLFDRAITIIDDPLRPRGLRSRPFDGEGLPVARSALIDKGVLTGWLMDSASARQLGLEPTGHASRGGSGAPGAGVTNVHMEPGSVSPAELMADIKRGIYVTELIGMGVNGVTGDYSRGAAGFLIEDGEITRPVSEITIASNLKDMFRVLVPANDLVFRYGMNVPTIRIDGMTVAGG
ncbi:TldD/PmbA family protein [Sphingomonadales bacterium 56]|uniref:TldD/PmbA family protein n=1 Tax=unclassified Sphingobium TaxID=2611147 RepID=UPI001917F770|nr:MULTISPECIES: TldD/PmbA family protein [unclassified Sphingobium]MBY2929018.1 TldD/PmbA family protein [Sphingomonadales bacterium 56]MBY2959130.1 TldD/PmbA family protein [Sphingomonadales bacterium 58]CAD7338360.1 Metalloprotease PmbA [Sphingobium sp. S6]CAD7338609.1 Metalloprotease PmbA [Sphingobium sp. S8]